MSPWTRLVEAWEQSLAHMEEAIDADDPIAAADAVWHPPDPAPPGRPDPEVHERLLDAGTRSRNLEARLRRLEVRLSGELSDASRRRDAARAYHA